MEALAPGHLHRSSRRTGGLGGCAEEGGCLQGLSWALRDEAEEPGEERARRLGAGP